MNILFDIGHPAHVHLFKNFISYLKSENHCIFVTSRSKEVTATLLDYYKIDHFELSSPTTGKLSMLKELRQRNKGIYELYRKYKFDVSFGTSVSIGFLKIKFGVPAFNFNEDDDAIVRLYTYLSYPFATKIINPDCIKFSNWKHKRVLYSSYHELAYLHPNNFSPDINLIKSYNLEPKKYVIVRLSALKAHHDSGAKGISENLLSRIKSLLSDYTIIESHELKKQYQIKPWDMHHVLAYAKMIISDSQTMTVEGAVLGIPSFRINTFIDKSTVISELEKKYKLAYGFYPNDEENIISTIKHLADNDEVDHCWQEKRKIMLTDKIDLNQWMIDFFEKEIKQ